MIPSIARSKIIFLTLALVAGIIILSPYHNFQNVISQGDHGHNLYCFKKTLDGALPYRDYYWPYGPLMPYYYALFLKLFGTSIQSVLLGKIVLNFLAGIFFYLAVSVFFSPGVGFIAATWFWTHKPDFIYTYNHVGGTAVSFAIIYFLFLYIKTFRRQYAYLGLWCAALLALVKLNFGLASLIAFVSSLWIVDHVNQNSLKRSNRYVYGLSALAILCVIAVIYWVLIRKLPALYLQQCFPYAGYLELGHRFVSYVSSSCGMWVRLFVLNFISSAPDFFFNTILLLCTIRTFYLLFGNKLDKEFRNQVTSALIVVVIFYVFNLHEFMVGGPVIYRTVWTEPFKFLFIFLIVPIAIRRTTFTLRSLLWGTVLLIVFLQVVGIYQMMKTTKTPEHCFSCGKTKIYINNPTEWIKIAEQTAGYLNADLGKDELFFAFPYDPLYYFLTGKDSPVREMMFFSIGEAQEKEIISTLETKKINFVLLSNRCNTQEKNLASTFGVTYGKILLKYLNDHFRVVTVFGNWSVTGDWILDHATMIFKRIEK